MHNQDKIHVLSRAVIIDQGKILLCQNTKLQTPYYFLPGGHIEQGESVKESLIREIKEEIGCDCSIKRFLCCLEYSFEPQHKVICHTQEYNFIFEITSPSLKEHITIKSEEDHMDFVWVPLDKLSTIDFSPPALKDLLKSWLLNDNAEKLATDMLKTSQSHQISI